MLFVDLLFFFVVVGVFFFLCFFFGVVLVVFCFFFSSWCVCRRFKSPYDRGSKFYMFRDHRPSLPTSRFEIINVAPPLSPYPQSLQAPASVIRLGSIFPPRPRP